MSFTVEPQPTEEEMAAILAAYEILWPRPSATVMPVPVARWRFASRSWTPRTAYGSWR